MRSRNDMDSNKLADAPGSSRTGIGGGFHRADITSHRDRHKSRADVLFSLQRHVGSLHHRVRGFDSTDESLGLDHAERFHASSVQNLKLHSITVVHAGGL